MRRLVARGDTVRCFSRRHYPELDQLGIEQQHGDLTNADAVAEAVAGCDIVFHVAAKAGFWGAFDDYYQANVMGTRHVLAACRRHGVQRLVHTSSPSVVFTGRDMEGVDESVPYATHFETPYPRTKAEAERLVLQANDSSLASVALRPHLIWGPGDPHIIPRLIARAKAGQLRRIGRMNKRVDSVYVDNAADAHLLAADRLYPGATVAGKAYFISQGEPVPLWDLINRILAAAGVPPVTRSVPFAVAYGAGWLLELLYGGLRLKGEPRMTRFLARELATAHWFNITAARRDLGYEPKVSMDEGLQRLAKAWQAEKANV